MWSDRINEFLDGERRLEEATDEEMREISVYRKVISIYAARLEYVPSRSGKEEFLRKVRRKRRQKYVWWGLVAAAIFVSLFVPFYLVPTMKERALMAMEPQERLESRMENVKINVDFEQVRTVMDGF